MSNASIRVDIGSPRVEVKEARARMAFRRLYQTGNLRLDERKNLLFRREGGVWRIQEESLAG